jgi:hypothetical protein
MATRTPLVHIFVDHSNIWGGARLASRVRKPAIDDGLARVSVRNLDKVLSAARRGITTKIVSGGIPPGMEGVWAEYQKAGYDTQRLIRDSNWKERGVDHSLIGHMWRLLAQHQSSPTLLVLASGDGRSNEFGTSFYEVVRELLTHKRYETWNVELASFDWEYPTQAPHRSPTNQRMRALVESSPRGKFVNLFDSVESLVYYVRP